MKREDSGKNEVSSQETEDDIVQELETTDEEEEALDPGGAIEMFLMRDEARSEKVQGQQAQKGR